MLVCSNSNSREPRGNPKHALPLWFSISSVTPAVLSYTLFPFQTRIILAFMDSTNKSEMSQIAGVFFGVVFVVITE